MIVVMGHSATEKQISDVLQKLDEINVRYDVSQGEDRTVIGLLGDTSHISRDALLDLEGVEEVIRITKPFKMASRDFHTANTVVRIHDVEVGLSGGFVIIAGPCSVESRDNVI